MGYIGVDINYGDIHKQVATSSGSTTPTGALDFSVPKSESIIVTLDGVTQVPGTDYNVTSGTTLTFTTSVPSGVVVLVYFLGRSLDIGTPGTGTVTNASVDGSAAIVTSKLSGAVTSIASHGLATSATTDTTNAANIGSGTLPIARLSAVPTSSLTGAVTSITSHGLATSATTDTTNAANIASGTLAVARGGTGAGTHTANNVLVGNGTSAIGSIAPSTSGNVLTSNGSAWASTAVAGGGKVLQVVSVTKTSVFSSTTSTAWTDITGLTLNITPASTGSKIWVTFHGHTDGNHGGYGYGIGLVRDSTLLGLGDAEGSRIRVTSAFHTYGSGDLTIQPFAGSFIDAPSSTSALTYKLQFYSPAATFVVNRYGIDTDSSTRQRPSSTITAIELSAATVSTT